MTEIMKRIYDKEWKEYLKYKEIYPERPYFNSIQKERAYFNLLGNYGFMTPKEYHITMMETLEELTPYDYEELVEIWDELLTENLEDNLPIEEVLEYFICVALEQDFNDGPYLESKTLLMSQ